MYNYRFVMMLSLVLVSMSAIAQSETETTRIVVVNSSANDVQSIILSYTSGEVQKTEEWSAPKFKDKKEFIAPSDATEIKLTAKATKSNQTTEVYSIPVDKNGGCYETGYGQFKIPSKFGDIGCN